MAVVSVQRGTLVFPSASNIQNVTISAIASTAHAIVRFSNTNASGSNNRSIWAEITSTTNIKFERGASPGSNVDLSWEVVEFDSAIVQHVSYTFPSTPVDPGSIAISAVTLANAWVHSNLFEALSSRFGLFKDAFPAPTFNSATQVDLNFNGTPPSSEIGNTLYYSIIDTPNADVQEITHVSTGILAETVAISAVTVANTELVPYTVQAGQIFAAGTADWLLASATLLELGTPTADWEHTVFVVDWNDGTTIQTGALTMGEGGVAAATTITSVDQSLTSINTTNTPWWYVDNYDPVPFIVALQTSFYAELVSATSIESFTLESPSPSEPRNTYQVIEYVGASTSQQIDAPLTTNTVTSINPSVQASPVAVDSPLSSISVTSLTPSADVGSVAVSAPLTSVNVASATVAAVAGSVTASAPLTTIPVTSVAATVDVTPVAVSAPLTSVAVNSETPNIVVPAVQVDSPLSSIAVVSVTPSAGLGAVLVASPLSSISVTSLAGSVAVSGSASVGAPLTSISIGSLSPSLGAVVGVGAPLTSVTVTSVTPSAVAIGAVSVNSPLTAIAVTSIDPAIGAAASLVSAPLSTVSVASVAPGVGVGPVALAAPLTSIGVASPALTLAIGAVRVDAPLTTVGIASVMPQVLGALVARTLVGNFGAKIGNRGSGATRVGLRGSGSSKL